MGSFLRNSGFALIAGWLVMLLVFEYIGKERPSWHRTVFIAGILSIVIGVLVRLAGNARGVVVRRRCVRCGKRVLGRQVYCAEHFHESVEQMREDQRDQQP